MKSHQLVSNRQIPAKLHDSLRFANRDDRNRSCSSVNAALQRKINLSKFEIFLKDKTLVLKLVTRGEMVVYIVGKVNITFIQLVTGQ